ncbi:MAG: VanZ family protein [Eubacteriales bacterium]|nr:VanZ family protein [Eubacteriales bacterium]
MKKGIKIILYVCLFASFVFYTLVLLYTLFAGRGYFASGLSLAEYIRVSSNIVPFKTIIQYVKALSDGSMNIDTPIKNLGGNLLMFLPMGIYLPGFFKGLRRPGRFCLCMVGILFVIEGAQLLLRLGSFDIDDFILNMAGALIGFAVWNSLSKRFKKQSPENA